MTTMRQSGVAVDDVLDVEGVSLSFGARAILDDVSFSIGGGEFTALIGSNGVGKTTLLRVILGLLRPDRGTVRVAGTTRSRRNPLIGYVPQTISLDPDMPLRARDFVALGIDGHLLGLRRRPLGHSPVVEKMLASVGAAHFADSRVGRLSGGEQQRVMIAHALVSRPRLLLLDEPLANLDIRSGQEVVELLHRLVTTHGVSVFISAHDMNPLLGFMSRIVYMAHGRVASGAPEQVVTSERLSELYRHPVDVVHVHDRVLVMAGRSHDEPPAGSGPDSLAAWH
ncbi:MAG: metal ABC transporter ATP-binding protein [Acidimicrobiales bacterium]